MRGGKRALCTTSFFYESVMRLKGGQKGYSRKTVAAHIKVVYRGGSGIERVVRPTIIAHRRRRCPEAFSVF